MLNKLSLILLLLVFTSLSSEACLSITDDFNSINPTLNADFNLLPDISPFTDCWSSSMRIRSDKNGWRLVATRTGPDPVSGNSNSSENVRSQDIQLNYTINSFGMADADGAVLVSPFSDETTLSSIGFGTFLVSGIKKSGNSCSAFNANFYRITQKLCLFRDFIFNTGQYTGQISYLLIAP